MGIEKRRAPVWTSRISPRKPSHDQHIHAATELERTCIRVLLTRVGTVVAPELGLRVSCVTAAASARDGENFVVRTSRNRAARVTTPNSRRTLSLLHRKKVSGSGTLRAAPIFNRCGRSGLARNDLPNETRSATPLLMTASARCRSYPPFTISVRRNNGRRRSVGTAEPPWRMSSSLASTR